MAAKKIFRTYEMTQKFKANPDRTSSIEFKKIENIYKVTVNFVSEIITCVKDKEITEQRNRTHVVHVSKYFFKKS